MRIPFIAALVSLTALPVLADETEGLVLAYDRQANILVLEDRTIWELPASLSVPEDLVAGDKVHLVYETAGEDGMVKIDAIHLLEAM